MGFNADNLFVKSDDLVAVGMSIAATYVKKPWKFALSVPVDGWIQVLDSHGEMPAAVAKRVSEILNTVTVWAQLYEGAGEVGMSVFESGIETESFHSEEAEDLAGELFESLKSRGIRVQMRLFREVIHQPGWSLEQGR